MKKTILSLLLALALCLSLFTVSCGGGNDDGDDGDDTPKALTKADYSEAYTKALMTLFNVTELPSSAPISYVDSSQSDDQNYYAVGAFMFFLRNLYANDNFEITDEAVNLTATYRMSIDGQVGEASMAPTMRSYRDENGILRNDLYQTVTEDDQVMAQYIKIDVDYDFETDTLKGFELGLLLKLNGELFMLCHYVYDGTSIKIFDSTVQDDDYNALLTALTARETDIVSRVANAKAIGDYTAEYTDAMVTQARIVFPDKTINPA